LAACSGASPTPNSTVLLAAAATKLAADTSFHFTIKEDHGGTPSGANTDIASAEGDVIKDVAKQDNRMSATADVTTMFGLIKGIQVIVVNDKAWAKTPLTGGQFQSADEYQGVGEFLAAGIPVILASLKGVGAASDGSANGVSSWKIPAKISSDQLSALTQGQVPAGQQIPVNLYIGKDDGQLRAVAIPGKLTSFDTDQTLRTIYLSSFDESVTISPPPGA
ncbi:MAG TPA: LppX_LprAFG lipoprotein, partial [Ktedonobacterales bacterium]